MNHWGKKRVKVDFTLLKVIESVNHIIWIGDVKYTALNEENKILRSISNRLTWVIKSSNGNLKIVHEHSSLPINMESFSGIVKKRLK